MMTSFLDELVKVGSFGALAKLAYGGGDTSGDVNTVDIPHGMVGSEPMPEVDRVAPHQASTRLPDTGYLPSAVKPGVLGNVTPPKDPIDREKYNRAYRDRR